MNAFEKITKLRSHVSAGFLVALGLVAALVWAFVELAEAVGGDETHSFDTQIMLLLRTPGDPSDPLGPAWIEELGRDVTALGGTGVLTFLIIAVSGFFWLNGNRRSTVVLLASVLSGIILSTVLKSGFDRPRPDLVPHGSLVYTASFPSGHSLMAAIVYLTLAVFVVRHIERRIVEGYVISLAVFIVVCVGVSRVYLGVHWPTDVLAGWAVGASWALICALAAAGLEHRRAKH